MLHGKTACEVTTTVNSYCSQITSTVLLSVDCLPLFEEAITCTGIAHHHDEH